MQLKNLLKNIITINPQLDREISGISADSRVIQSGFLFAAFPGVTTDGRNYITEAIKNGAIVVICEAEGFVAPKLDVPLIKIKNLHNKIGNIAAQFYNNPSKNLTMIGITGTNGKTSCSQFLAKALELNQISCGIIGTLGSGFPDKLNSGNLTTPDPINIQQDLSILQQQGAKAVAMEVSSHGLAQQRVNGIDFNIAVFTNLTQDHLDYHGTMENYTKAKRQLLIRSELQHAVINADDEFGRSLITELQGKLNIIGYSITDIKSEVLMLRATNIELKKTGLSTNISTPWGDGVLTSNLLGRFNVSNLLAVLVVLGIMQIPLAKALRSIAKLTTIPGRLQVFGGGIKPLVVVDFAHTPDALQQVLINLREHCQGKLCCVFGCGGDRDKNKRPIMGRIAENYSDQVIITNDNPRTENPEQIINDIVQGFVYSKMKIIPNRSRAIEYAIDQAKAGDVVLIAGKGHEPYQIIGTKKIPFSDIKEVEDKL
jgi:UDP-N-acetylmuramoyl-L-alanyl-D-glutamate--2,6-diaminopimelate ligase